MGFGKRESCRENLSTPPGPRFPRHHPGDAGGQVSETASLPGLIRLAVPGHGQNPHLALGQCRLMVWAAFPPGTPSLPQHPEPVPAP